VAKRSPIAGYNHNVRYRGLIFHVQTEDSGLQSPHLFTHMFYGGVIISTRKLVYDAGSAEDAIKGLMQSQHKVVLRDLKRGLFDDKIDQYLVGTEGLLPRGITGDEGERPVAPASAPLAPDPEIPRESSPVLQVRMSEPEITLSRPGTDHEITPEMMELDEPPPPPVIARAATPPPIPQSPTPAPVQARTRTAERTSRPGKVRDATRPPPPPSPEELDPPTLNDSTESIAAAVAAANIATTRTESPLLDSGPLIEIKLELEDSDEMELPRRAGRDTDIAHSDGVPPRTGADSIQPLPPPPKSTTGDRISAVGAATLPPARPIARPPSRQAISPPAAVSRPPTNDDVRARGDSDAAEGSGPASGELPGERPGQYAQHKRVSQRVPVDVIKGGSERSAPVAIPSGLARPGRPPSQAPSNAPGSGGIPQRVAREVSPQPQTQPMHTTPAAGRAGTPQRPGTPSPSSSYRNESSRPPERARTPTPARVAASSPTPSRVPSTSSGGVVMTRPAVIVGAPAKPTAPKVRKAREEEGRGFGQGLISEKSLDEVILAYLSEDADEK